jgi:ubiquilin
MQIFIKTSTEAKQPIDISPTATIQELKEAISVSTLSIPVDNQRLIFTGKVLKDSDMLELLNVKEGCTIHLVKSQIKNSSPTTKSTQSEIQNASTTPTPAAAHINPSTPSDQASSIPRASFSRNAAFPSSDLSSSILSNMDPQMMQMMMNPEIMQRTALLMQQHPELLNMAAAARSTLI